MKTYTLFHSFKLTLVLLTLSLTLGISNAWGAIADGTYVLCTSTSDLEAGAHYIIASGTSGSVYCISNESNSDNRKAVSASVSSSKITVAANSTIMTFTLGGSSGAWTLYTDNYTTNGYLASATSGTDKNRCRVASESTTGTISFSDNAAVITLNPHSSRNILRYNSNNGNPLFACYSSGQAAVYLYKKQSCTSISPTLSYSTDSIGIGGTATVASLNKDGSTGSVTYSVSPASGVATINASTGELTGTGTGNVTVTATIAAAGGKCEGTATATIKVRRGITYYVGATSYTVGGIDGNTLVSTLPASPSSCDDTNYPYFYGWKNGSISGISSSAPTILSSELVSSSTAANTYYAVFTNVANLTFGFESGEDETGWTNVITGMSNLGSYVTAHGGSRAASVSGSTTTIIQTANKIIPSAFSAWITKESGNTDTPSEWKLQKSTDGSSWTDVASWSATSPTRGTWNKITLSASQIASITVESYIRIILSTTISAYRDMDDVSISYGTGDPEYITTCCTALGQINGSVNLTQGGNSVTISGWSDVSDVGTYTVKMYKKNGGGTWDLVSGTASGGSAGTEGERTGITSGSKSVTYTGLEVENEYKFTVQAIAGSAAYCDGEETDVTNINSTDVSSTPFKFRYSICIDDGTGNNWTHHYITPTGNTDEGAVTLTSMPAHVDCYQFKIYGGFSGNWGQTGTGKIEGTTATAWTLNGGNQVYLKTGAAGDYVFTVDYSGTTNPKVSVTYPSADQDEGYVIYYDNSVLNWSNLYYRIGNNSSCSKVDDVALVPGTDKFYKVTTPDFNSMDAWHIANNYGWTGSNSIYRTKTDDAQSDIAITNSINFQQYVVTEDITVIPTTTHSTGGDDQNNNCEFYTINTPTSGMLTHNVAVGSAEHGTVVATYTNTSGTANQTVAEGANADLAHRCIVTITATPDEGYSCTALTVNGAAFTSGDEHILTADATIAATFTAQTSTVTLDNNDATSGSQQTVSATYDATMPLTTTSSTPVAALSRTGYTFTGWWDAASSGTQYYSYNAGTSTLSSARTWNKTGAQTLKAQWSINSYTLTWAWGGGSTSAASGEDYTAAGSVAYNTALEYPADNTMSRNGYTFTGWSSSATHMPAEALTITAQWEAKQYTVTLDNKSATTSGSTSVTATFDAILPTITPPTKEGYRFDGYWTEASAGTQYIDVNGNGTTAYKKYTAGEHKLHAHWVAQLTFSVNGEVDDDLTRDDNAAMPTSATVPMSCGDCWTFAGWSTDEDEDGAPAYDGGDTHTFGTPTTLYAVYQKGETAEYSTEPSCPTYTITWVVNGETYSTGTPTTSTNECTGITTLPTAPSNNTLACADKFMGWSEATLTGTGNDAPDDLFTNAAGAPTIDGNKTFYAVFAKATLDSEGSFDITASDFGTSYSSSETKFTKISANDIGYVQCISNGNGTPSGWNTGEVIQMKSGNGLLYNNTAISGLCKLRIIAHSNASALTVYYGTSKKSTSNSVSTPFASATGTQSITYTKVSNSGTATVDLNYYDIAIPSGNNFFYLSTGSGTPYIRKITVYYANYTYSDYMTSCCDELVTLTTNSPANGTITFEPAGPIATCEANQNVTMTITPSPGYKLSAWSVATGDGKVAATNTTPAVVTGEDNSDEQEITLTFSQHTTGNYDVSATFEQMHDEYFDYMHDNAKVGGNRTEAYSAPSRDSKTAASGEDCKTNHYKFKGWVVQEEINDDGTLKDGYTLITAGSSMTASNKIYYAVWAEEQ